MTTKTEHARTRGLASFQILVDDPAEDPALGFPGYADAFAEIVCGSPPRFAIGIFGSWGSGKTTLMRAIEARIEDRDDVIPVWFNAWRYEREQHLIVPLLDVLREALHKWANQEEEKRQEAAPTGLISRARRAAAAMGAAARAIAMGVTLSAKVPGGFAEAKLELEKIRWNEAADDQPVSLYHASFTTMADAVRTFITADGERAEDDPDPVAQRRIVVFVDDLDRCLPLNALAVLESMKLFFDLEGFVFVAGLDQQVIERAIELRYAEPGERERAESSSPADDEARGRLGWQGAPPATGVISGRDYIKKIFQVPFGLPPVDNSQLEDLVRRLMSARHYPRLQEQDLQGRILRHLEFFSDESGVNPREVKRLVNAYTLQAKLMSLKLPRVDRDLILALQVIAFRRDWERVWRPLEADPDGYVNRLSRGVTETKGADTVWVDGEPLPPRLVDYLKGPAKTLLTSKSLRAYLSSSQTSHTSDTSILQAQAAVDELRRVTGNLEADTDRKRLGETLSVKMDALSSTLGNSRWAGDLRPLVARLEQDASQLNNPQVQPPIIEWAQEFRARLDRLDTDLRALRDRFSLRAP